MLMKYQNFRELTSIIQKISIPENLKRTELVHAGNFLEFLEKAKDKRLVLDDFYVLEPWAILLLATLAKTKNESKIFIENNKTTKAAKFATALGFDEIIYGETNIGNTQQDRTVKLCTITRYEDIDRVAGKISKLIFADCEESKTDELFDKEETILAIRYVLIELIRNVIQHSYDPDGALVIAQRMKKGEKNDENTQIQVAVSDCGIGIPQSLKATRKDINDPKVALERSIWPAYSGKFNESQTGTSQNAGMGLFFVSEMAKLTAGQFFVASRGATLYIKGDPEFEGKNLIQLSDASFEGTFVVFEMPKKGVIDYQELNRTIINKSIERRADRQTKNWIRFDIPKEETIEFVVNIAAENTVKAEEFAKNTLIPQIENGRSLTLNFINIPACTQSFMHSVIYEVLKLSYKKQIPIFINHAEPVIKDLIKMVESYTLKEKNLD